MEGIIRFLLTQGDYLLWFLLSRRDQPLIEPIMTPLTKYFWTKG